MKLVILGPAGSGKGQNTARIARKYNLKHVVVGDIVKKEIREKTDVGKIMYDYTSVGKFVPTNLVMQVLNKQLKKLDGYDGYIIDTAPINMEQFEKMNIEELDAAISLEVADYDILRERVLNRLRCPSCFAVTSVLDAPEGHCLDCGAELEHRYDDNLPTLNFRLKQYENETVPVIKSFKALGKLIKVDASGDKDEVFKQICNKINRFFSNKAKKEV
ncbi:MAG: nucleoside monophosphate kinase [Clostridia bacterium]|nr:nucleoside monophosphate kinase [Clostridia bacterium]